MGMSEKKYITNPYIIEITFQLKYKHTGYPKYPYLNIQTTIVGIGILDSLVDQFDIKLGPKDIRTHVLKKPDIKKDDLDCQFFSMQLIS